MPKAPPSLISGKKKESAQSKRYRATYDQKESMLPLSNSLSLNDTDKMYEEIWEAVERLEDGQDLKSLLPLPHRLSVEDVENVYETTWTVIEGLEEILLSKLSEPTDNGTAQNGEEGDVKENIKTHGTYFRKICAFAGVVTSIEERFARFNRELPRTRFDGYLNELDKRICCFLNCSP